MEDKDATTKSVEQKLNPSKDSRIQEGQRKARVCHITHKRRPGKLIAWGLSDKFLLTSYHGLCRILDTLISECSCDW